MSNASLQPDSPWPHRLAVLMVCATFPLIWIGGLVTTTQAGMAVPDWPNTYGYNLFLYPWTTWLLGPWDLFIEHGHRLLAAGVGVLAIALVVVTWVHERRRWIRVMSAVALVLVCVQGALGGMRVLLDARTLAQIHGCVGPAFFAICVALAVFTSPRWVQISARQEDPSAGRLHRVAIVTTALAYFQLVLGSMLRHVPIDAAPTAFRTAVLFHLLVAGLLAGHCIVLCWHLGRHYRKNRELFLPAVALLGLIAFQVGLGAASWVVKYGWPAWAPSYPWIAAYTIQADSFLQSLIVTGHVATGSLILVTALLIALRSLRQFRSPARSLQPKSIMAGVAV